MKYYVYTHKLNGNVFYVGKGSKNRSNRFSLRSQPWNDFVGDNQKGIEVDIVRYFDDESQAYKFEEELTTHYKKLGQAQANVIAGVTISENVKRKISEGLKGENNGRYGVTGKDHQCSKPIELIFPDGNRITTTSRKELAVITKEKYGLSIGAIQRIIKSKEPYDPMYKRHAPLKGIIIKYIA